MHITTLTLSALLLSGVAPETAAEALKEAATLVEVKANTSANLERAIALYEQHLTDTSVPAARRATGYVDLARAYMRYGDIRPKAERVAIFEKGVAAAKKGKALAPNRADTIAYVAFLKAKVGDARGIMNSLMMVGEVKKDLEKALKIDPNYHYARTTLAVVYHALPGIAGGSDRKAIALLEETLERDPHFTAAMKDLGNLYLDKGDEKEARKWFQRIVDEKAPSRKHDCNKWDRPIAKRKLAKMGG
jgi:tetratricopeptide (TPR) repeat protein